jgi:hypothetical protein
MRDWVMRYDERVLGTELLDAIFCKLASGADFSEAPHITMDAPTLERFSVGMHRAIRRNLNGDLARTPARAAELAAHAVLVGARIDKLRAAIRQRTRRSPSPQSPDSSPPQHTDGAVRAQRRMASLRRTCDAALEQHAIFCRRVEQGGAALGRISIAVSRTAFSKADVNVDTMLEEDILAHAKECNTHILVEVHSGALADERRPHVTLPALAVIPAGQALTGPEGPKAPRLSEAPAHPMEIRPGSVHTSVKVCVRAAAWGVPQRAWGAPAATEYTSVIYEGDASGVHVLCGATVHVAVVINDVVVARDIFSIGGATSPVATRPRASTAGSAEGSSDFDTDGDIGSEGDAMIFAPPSQVPSPSPHNETIGASGIVRVASAPSQHIAPVLWRALVLPALARAPEYVL